MAPESESLEAKVARLDERQKAHEKTVASVLKVAEEAKEIAMESKEAVATIHTALASMPQDIILAIEEKNKRKGVESREVVVVAIGIMAFLTQIPAAIQALKQLFGG